MRVLHVSFADAGGGAALAAARLHRAQRALGIASKMLVLRRVTDDPDVMRAGTRARLSYALSWRLESWLLRFVTHGESIERSLHLLPGALHRQINASDADVVHLHGLHGILGIAEIARIKKPLVWTLHDMWPFAGAEHYPVAGDERWMHGYRRDSLDGWTWHRKRARWRDLDVVLVAPSRWMAEQCRESALFRRHPAHLIPNTFDPDEFMPREMAAARRRLNLPLDRRIVLFGAHDPALHRKGFDLLAKALALLAASVPRDSVELVVFSRTTPPAGTSIPVRTLGWIDRDLDQLYSAADVLVAPSRMDNLANIVVEAAACGLPAVAFHIGGMPDLIDHRRTGYLAAPFDADDLAKGIDWVLAQPATALRSLVAERARRFAPDAVVPAHQQVYEAALARP
jgi:glycosyltransferase involved in cell wall biosynthesis